MTYRKITANELFEIKKLRLQGLTVAQIAENIGRDAGFVSRNALKNGIIKPRNIKDRLSQGDRMSFGKKWRSGRYTNKELGKMFGISVPSVKRLARALELPHKYSKSHPFRQKARERMKELYVEKKLSTAQIGKILTEEFGAGISDEKVRKELQKMGIGRRETNGLTKSKITRQNKIIREMYEAGDLLDDITKASGVGKHGIDKRLAAMGIERSRNPYKPWGDKHDSDIDELFRKGHDILEISQMLNLNSPMGVAYRLKRHIYPNHVFRIRYRSNLNGKLRTSTRRYETFMQLQRAKRRIRKHLGPETPVWVMAEEKRVRAKDRLKWKHKGLPILR